MCNFNKVSKLIELGQQKNFVLLLFLVVILFSCSPAKKVINNGIEFQLSESKNISSSLYGLYVYDPGNKKEIVNINSEKLFTPASNTKIFTFFICLNTVKDSIAVLKYYQKNDTVLFFGLAYPGFLNPYIEGDTIITGFLKNRKEKLFYSDSNYREGKFGLGWAWDDYMDYYQCEKSSLPIYGNTLSIEFENDTIAVYPDHLRNNIEFSNDSFLLFRSSDNNKFEVGKFENKSWEEIPLRMDTKSVIEALQYESGKGINEWTGNLDGFIGPFFIKQKFNDSLYIRLMHNSDNFVAEQLLLSCSSTIGDTISTSNMIKYAIQNYMPYLSSNSKWVDGSGLSRYNLFKPTSIVKVLEDIYAKIGLVGIQKYFPEIVIYSDEENVNNDTVGKVFAKTGTLSNNFNLSGYIFTKKSNVYIFSFMNNHFLAKPSMIRTEVKTVLKNIIENY
jgi:D-alanyl-D-alanine carboxypeptidase/D-alanyl-D-alanine-endopeptidase (penicillin-binding protein 4)